VNILNTCLFRLTAVWQKNGPRPGKPLRRTIVRDFPDAAGAESFLKENNPAGNWPYLFCYQLEMMPERLDGSGSPVMIFERNGNKYGVCDNYKSNCFPGRLEADCRFKRGDIVQFVDIHYKLDLGVVWSLLPNPDVVKQTGDENEMLESGDDMYLVLSGEAGMENNYLHECKLFIPDAPIPDTITALQKTVLAGIRPVKEFYQKKLFFRWLADNKQLFGREPYLVEEDGSSFSLQFNGIVENISCCFVEHGDIMIVVHYRNKFFDIVTDFDLYEEQTPDGRFLCTLCDKNPDNTNKNALVYEIRDELWIKHSFEPLAQWTRKMFTDDALLCLCRYGDTTAAFIEFGEALEKLRKREKIYKEIPVINIDVNYEKSVDL